MVVTEKEVMIPFCVPGCEELLQDVELTGFLMDWTYKTNQEGVLLGVIGPVGLVLTTAGWTMRMLPAYFMLSSSENDRATRRLLDIYLQRMLELGKEVTDGYFDCACLSAVQQHCKEKGLQIYLHRCLQHCKNNVSDEAARRDRVTGTSRLRNKELLSPIRDWITFSATLPDDLEFDCFWTSILGRMFAKEAVTDFDESAMGKYLKDHILDASGLCPSKFCLGCEHVCVVFVPVQVHLSLK